MLSFNELKDELKKLLNTKVENAIIRIWPDREGLLEDTDVELSLKLCFSSSEVKSVTFCTDSDGQTPKLYYEGISIDYKLSELSDRIKVWKTSEFWRNIDQLLEKHYEGYNMYNVYECFDIKDSDEYSDIISSYLIGIDIYYYHDEIDKIDKKLPIGLRLEFSSKKIVYSFGYGDVNWTSIKYPTWLKDLYKGVQIQTLRLS